MGLLIMSNTGHYLNKNAVHNVVQYITRTRKGETKEQDLLGYGAIGVGVYTSAEEIIRHICYVQELNRISARGGRRMYHEWFLIKDEEYWMLGNNIELVKKIAWECASLFFVAGFQVVYGIHWQPDKRLHIHFGVSTINIRDGRKWHSSKRDLEYRMEMFNKILYKYIALVQVACQKEYCCPIEFIA